MNNDNEVKKSGVPVWIRVLAMVLAVLLVGELVVAGMSQVDFSSEEYAGEETEDMAEYIQKNDEYINAGFLSRMRTIVRTIGSPSDFEEYYMFASVAIADNDYAKAAGYLEECIGMYSGDDSGLVALLVKQGCVYALEGEWEAAKETLEKATGTDKSDSDAFLMLAKVCYNMQEYSDGAAAMAEYCALVTPDGDDYALLATMQYEAGEYQSTADSCTAGLETDNSDAMNLKYIRSKAYYRLGNFAAARQDALECASLGGDIEENMTFAAGCCEAEEDYAGALEIIMDMIEAGINDDSAYQTALACALKAEDYPSQEKILTKLLETERDEDTEASLRSTLAVARLSQGKYEEAEAELENLIIKNPDNPQIVYLRGICRMNLQNYLKAYNDFDAVIDAGADELVDECYYNMAVCMINRGRENEAEYLLNMIIERNEDPDMIEMSQQLLEDIF